MTNEQGQHIGRLMPQADQATLEASPGIQNWSHPRGKVATRLWDDTSVERFAQHWSRNWAGTYPYDSKAANDG
jgi:hypothetical protein